MSAEVATRLQEPTDNALERICDAHWNKSGEGVKFLDIHQHNACNHTLSGTIDVDGVVYGFIIESGDRNGTVVRAWGDPEDVGTYDPGPPPELRTFIPRDPKMHDVNSTNFQLYLLWRKEQWFKEKERAYNYDRHFQPGRLIEGHYRGWAEKKGMTTGYLSSLPEDCQNAVRKAAASEETHA